jgi:hypothetical protein
MTVQAVAAAIAAALGIGAAAVAIYHERQMQRHRQPGVTYGAVTWRRDGAWRRSDLFTPQGLAHQARAAKFGFLAVASWVLALILWIVLARVAVPS